MNSPSSTSLPLLRHWRAIVPTRTVVAPLLYLVWMLLSSATVQAQSEGQAQSQNTPADSSEKERPDQFDVFKINLGQIGVNEARLLYEFQTGPAASVEVGAGFIYPNAFWFEQGGEALLGTGGGIYASYRKYRISERYFSKPFFRPYISPQLFYRHSRFTDEWILLAGSSAAASECARVTQNLNQIGTAIRFGWQTTQGRVVLDLYGGLGLKFTTFRGTQTALNTETDVCIELPDTDFTLVEERFSETTIIIQGGIKLGIRRNNRERNYEAPNRSKSPEPSSEEQPPSYRP